MLRPKWEFEYTAKHLALAAIAQRDFRSARRLVWMNKREEVMAKIRETGLTIHEDVAAGMASNNVNAMKYSTAGYGGPQVLVDATMQQDLNDCTAKIHEHTELQKQYAAWVQVLEANGEARLKLDHDDWMFFFGK
jgi:hypothetical protein